VSPQSLKLWRVQRERRRVRVWGWGVVNQCECEDERRRVWGRDVVSKCECGGEYIKNTGVRECSGVFYD